MYPNRNLAVNESLFEDQQNLFLDFWLYGAMKLIRTIYETVLRVVSKLNYIAEGIQN
jgi:hypothetical protein